MEISFVLPFIIGCLVTAGIAFVIHRSKLNEVQSTLSATTNAQLTVLGEKLKAAEQRLTEAADMEKQISERFKALSLDALKSNNESFLSLARSQDLLITSVCAAPAPRPQPAGGGIGTTSSEL